ncbi:MAG: hypothetical protein KDE33_24195 [Bacteroidetes bacterium]|nr:hypothetical protein [Bacteroidota bacterium]
MNSKIFNEKVFGCLLVGENTNKGLQIASSSKGRLAMTTCMVYGTQTKEEGVGIIINFSFSK